MRLDGLGFRDILPPSCDRRERERTGMLVAMACGKADYTILYYTI